MTFVTVGTAHGASGIKGVAQGRRLAQRLINKVPSCPITEIARLDKTLRRWQSAFLAHCGTADASDGGTKVVNGIIELGCRITVDDLRHR